MEHFYEFLTGFIGGALLTFYLTKDDVFGFGSIGIGLLIGMTYKFMLDNGDEVDRLNKKIERLKKRKKK